MGPVRACDVIHIAGSFYYKSKLSRSKGEVYPFQIALRLIRPGRFSVFSPSPHLSPWIIYRLGRRYKRREILAFISRKGSGGETGPIISPSRWILGKYAEQKEEQKC